MRMSCCRNSVPMLLLSFEIDYIILKRLSKLAGMVNDGVLI